MKTTKAKPKPKPKAGVAALIERKAREMALELRSEAYDEAQRNSVGARLWDASPMDLQDLTLKFIVFMSRRRSPKSLEAVAMMMATLLTEYGKTEEYAYDLKRLEHSYFSYE